MCWSSTPIGRFLSHAHSFSYRKGEDELCNHKPQVSRRTDTVQPSYWSDVFGFLPKCCMGVRLRGRHEDCMSRGVSIRNFEAPLEQGYNGAHDVQALKIRPFFFSFS